MINFVRKVVAGPKNRTVDEKYDLDLTYITDRIIAMAFPAAGFEKTYRNSIDDVTDFFKTHHGENFLIINASNRKYEYEKFNDQVLEFFWTDHQAPSITTLFEVCEKIQYFIDGN
jgi:phosphatidylinositol-3,4,5-trisphosphate 3-phosphatase/dual-specificity protein phosphatase PTEN